MPFERRTSIQSQKGGLDVYAFGLVGHLAGIQVLGTLKETGARNWARNCFVAVSIDDQQGWKYRKHPHGHPEFRLENP